MKRIAYFLILFSLLAGATSAVSQNCYYQVWSDEFDEDGAPSADNWVAETSATSWQRANSELQDYTDRIENAECSNGTLKITAIKEPKGSYTSARLMTYGLQSFKYGKIEARMKLPYGKGIWPAFWMMGNNYFEGTVWPVCGEVEIMEMAGSSLPEKGDYRSKATPSWADASGALARPQPTEGFIENSTPLSADFHVYGIEWTSSYIKWYFDGVKYYEFSTLDSERNAFQKDFYLLLNLAVGGNEIGYPDEKTVFPQVLEIDYVRVYSLDKQSIAVTGDKIATAGKSVDFSLDNSLNNVTYTWSVPADASIISGQGTSTINVTWGSTSGNVQCLASGDCAQAKILPLNVESVFSPSGESYEFPLVGNNASVWTSNKALNGSLTVSANGNSNLEVAFEFNGGKTDSYIAYAPPALLDLKQYSEMQIALKPLSGNLPRNVRVDLIDINGKVNSNDLFVISSLNPKHNFYIYSHKFNVTATDLKLDRIKYIRVYVNNQVNNLATIGTFEIGSVTMYQPNVLGIVTTPTDSAYVLQPQDASLNLLWSGSASGSNSVTPVLNGDVVDVTFDIVDATTPVKLIYTLPNALNMGYHNQLELKVVKDALSDLPANISVALVDETGFTNATENWLVSDFAAINSSGFLHHAFGNSANGGEWLPCRTQKIEITINKDVATPSSGKFSITALQIIKEPVNTSWRESNNEISNLQVYPNPVDDILNVDLSSYTGVANIKITDISGRIIMQIEVLAGAITEISTVNLPKGTYFIQVKANDSSKGTVFIKQ